MVSSVVLLEEYWKVLSWNVLLQSACSSQQSEEQAFQDPYDASGVLSLPLTHNIIASGSVLFIFITV